LREELVIALVRIGGRFVGRPQGTRERSDVPGALLQYDQLDIAGRGRHLLAQDDLDRTSRLSIIFSPQTSAVVTPERQTHWFLAQYPQLNVETISLDASVVPTNTL
jgi:hypothetical protein